MYNILSETDSNRIKKRGVILNIAAGLVSALFNSILLFFVTRLANVSIAGVFSIACALSYQTVSIGKLATYNVQVSDIKKEYSFSDFFWVRTLSSCAMLVLLAYYAFSSGYTQEKALIILSYGLLKGVDAIEDIYRGEYHRQQRLDIDAYSFLLRQCLSIVFFAAAFFATRDLISSTFITVILSLLSFYFINKNYIKHFGCNIGPVSAKAVKSLLIILIPLSIAAFLKVTVVNIPKYAIDRLLASDMQTYYSILILPSSIINLFTEIIFTPMIPQLSIYIEDKDKRLYSLISLVLIIICAFTGICIAGGRIIGLRLLEFVYDVSLSNYKSTLDLLLIAGGFTALSTFFQLILIILRKQNIPLIANLLSIALAYYFCDRIVIAYQLHGAALLYLIQTTFICFVLAISMATGLIKRQKGD